MTATTQAPARARGQRAKKARPQLSEGARAERRLGFLWSRPRSS